MTPLASHGLLVFLAAIAALLAVARLLGRLAERIGVPAIVGELATGVTLGPLLFLHVLPRGLALAVACRRDHPDQGVIKETGAL